MATLRNGISGESFLLRAHHVLGRDQQRCDTVIVDPYVSRIHASIRWAAARWELHDHSRNGTLVSGTVVGEGKFATLQSGDVIHFGGAGQLRWLVDDIGDPADTLWPLRGLTRPIVLDHAHILPGDVAPAVTVIRSEDGEWLCDDTDTPRVLRDGDEVSSGNFAWRLMLARRNFTATLPCISQLAILLQRIDFVVSLNEEHVGATLQTRGGNLDLGARAHHYCLVTLARLRCAHAQAGYDTGSQGWIDLELLARMLGMDVSHVNVQIHRARLQVTPLLSASSPELIERRRGSVRFGALAFRVIRGEKLECQSLPAGRPDAQAALPTASATPALSG